MQIGGNKAAAIINVTPMIDILLVLLIVFMLLPTKTVGLKSDVPQLATDNQPAIPNPQNLVLRIRKDRSMDINSQPVVLAQLHERLQTFLPLRDLPELKDVAPFYYEWLAHSPADPWWEWADLHNKYGRVHAAVLNLSGWYDEADGPNGATTSDSDGSGTAAPMTASGSATAAFRLEFWVKTRFTVLACNAKTRARGGR